jgi:hypothetical protein
MFPTLNYNATDNFLLIVEIEKNAHDFGLIDTLSN